MQCRRPGLNPWVRKIPWRREWLPTPVFLPGEFRGQRSQEGYSTWGRKESDMTEQLMLSFFYALVHMPSINTQTSSTCPENSTYPSHFFLISRLEATADSAHYHLVLPCLSVCINAIIQFILFCA